MTAFLRFQLREKLRKKVSKNKIFVHKNTKMYMIIENQILVCIITHILLAVLHFHLKNKILILYQYCESLNVLATTIFAFNMRKSQMNIYMVTEEFLSALILLPCFPAPHLSL